MLLRRTGQGVLRVLARSAALALAAASPALADPVQVLAASFDAGLPAGWTASGLWHVTPNPCAPGDWCGAGPAAYYGVDASCNVNAGGSTSGMLTLPAITLPGGSATLTYCSAYQSNSFGGGPPPEGPDAAWVEVNGFVMDDVVDYFATGIITSTRSIDLTPFAGQTVTISFRFNVGGDPILDGLGWMIDNVALVADPDEHSRLVAWGDVGNNSGVINIPAGGFAAVSAGSHHNVGLRTDGSLVSWGSNSNGEISGTPVGIFSAAGAGLDHSVALRTDGTLVAWGRNNHGQISNTPAGTFTTVAAGFNHSVAIRADGTLASWGSNLQGQVTGTPAGVFVAATAGGFGSAAIRTDGTLICWGSDAFGQVSNTPAGTFTAVSAGGSHNVAIRTDGTLVSWGQNNAGQVSGTPTGTFVAVDAGNEHSVAVRTDGTLVSWGNDFRGQVGNTPRLGTFSAVSAGAGHSIAIRAAVDLDDPVAADDFHGVHQGGLLHVAAPGILANDTDPGEDPLVVELITPPAFAAYFQASANGSFTYTPMPAFFGEDSFTYRVSNGVSSSPPATVHVTVSQPGSQGFITGGGRFFHDNRRCTFGFVAKVQGGGVQGRFEFQDHEAAVDIEPVTMQAVYSAGPMDGQFGGTCRLNGVPGHTFFVQVQDPGQPGNGDSIAIWVFDSSNALVYQSGGSLDGGNIVIHGH